MERSFYRQEPVLAGAHLDIRPFAEADIDARYLGWLNDPVIMRYSNQRFRHHTHESALAYLRSFTGSDNRFLLVTRRADGAPVGTLTVYAAPPHGTVDVGIMIGDGGCGYGQEAWDLVIAWLLGEPQVRKITAGTLAVNVPMRKLMERSAMAREATRRAQETVDGDPVDVVYYARFRHV